MMLDLFDLQFLLSILRITTPLLLAASGGLLAWRAGVINLGLEGYMLLGAFSASAATVLLGNLAAGLVISCLVVGLVAAAMSYAIVVRGADQIVSGIMFNILMLGLTTYLASLLRGVLGAGRLSTAAEFGQALNALRTLPVIGALFEVIDPFLLVALLAIGLIALVINRSFIGLSIVAVGEQARAADAAGVSVNQLRSACYIIGSVLAGIAGSFLSVSYIGMFTTNMTAGQGYIAISVIILGRWRPGTVLLSSLVFGLAFAVQIRQQHSGIGLPVEVVLAFPYLLTLVIVASAGRASGPAEEGRPFIRGSR